MKKKTFSREQKDLGWVKGFIVYIYLYLGIICLNVINL